MKIIRLLAWALFLVLLLAGPAAANAGPASGIVDVSWLMVLFLFLLSLAGGAYPILARLDPNRSRWWRIALRWVGSILLIWLSPVLFLEFGAIAVLPVVLILWILSLYRSVQMIRWAKQARASDPKPEHLITANPWRQGPWPPVRLRPCAGSCFP